MYMLANYICEYLEILQNTSSEEMGVLSDNLWR